MYGSCFSVSRRNRHLPSVTVSDTAPIATSYDHLIHFSTSLSLCGPDTSPREKVCDEPSLLDNVRYRHHSIESKLPVLLRPCPVYDTNFVSFAHLNHAFNASVSFTGQSYNCFELRNEMGYSETSSAACRENLKKPYEGYPHISLSPDAHQSGLACISQELDEICEENWRNMDVDCGKHGLLAKRNTAGKSSLFARPPLKSRDMLSDGQSEHDVTSLSISQTYDVISTQDPSTYSHLSRAKNSFSIAAGSTEFSQFALSSSL